MGKGNEDEEKVSFMDGLSASLSAFGKFLYNSDDGTVMGRDGKSWARISVFYLFYYAFLACLFAISINITLSCLDEEKPYFQTRLQAPGVTIQPKLPSEREQNSDIKYSVSDADSYEKYQTQLNEFLEPYQVNAQNGEDFKDCTVPVDVADQNQPNQKVCKQNVTQLGLCAGGEFGYPDGKPCLLLKVNRIIGWSPAAYTNLEKQDNAENRADNSKAPSLQEFLDSESIPYNKDLMYISCYGLNEDDKKNLGEVTVEGAPADANSIQYFPEGNPGIPSWNYPYHGKKVQPAYISPVIAVKFNNIKRGELINVGCKAYALNILDDLRTNSGFIHFKIQIDN